MCLGPSLLGTISADIYCADEWVTMRVAVLCIGNELLMDEGVGPSCARYLRARYEFPTEVDVLDRSVMGMAILSDLRVYDYALVLDALEVPGAQPGQLFSFAPEDAAPTPAGMTSLHEVRFADVLGSAELLGIRCAGHCLGIQAENLSPSELVMALTPRVAAAIPLLAQAAVRHLRRELGLEVRDLLSEADGLCAGSGGVGARTFGRTASEAVGVESGDAARRVVEALPEVYGEPEASVMGGYLAAGLVAIGLEASFDGKTPCRVDFVLPAATEALAAAGREVAVKFGLDAGPEIVDGGLRCTAWVSPLITDYDCDALIGACLELVEVANK